MLSLLFLLLFSMCDDTDEGEDELHIKQYFSEYKSPIRNLIPSHAWKLNGSMLAHDLKITIIKLEDRTKHQELERYEFTFLRPTLIIPLIAGKYLSAALLFFVETVNKVLSTCDRYGETKEMDDLLIIELQSREENFHTFISNLFVNCGHHSSYKEQEANFLSIDLFFYS